MLLAKTTYLQFEKEGVHLFIYWALDHQSKFKVNIEIWVRNMRHVTCKNEKMLNKIAKGCCQKKKKLQKGNRIKTLFSRSLLYIAQTLGTILQTFPFQY